jgi:hypothetical protein
MVKVAPRPSGNCMGNEAVARRSSSRSERRNISIDLLPLSGSRPETTSVRDRRLATLEDAALQDLESSGRRRRVPRLVQGSSTSTASNPPGLPGAACCNQAPGWRAARRGQSGSAVRFTCPCRRSAHLNTTPKPASAPQEKPPGHRQHPPLSPSTSEPAQVQVQVFDQRD